MKSQVVLGIAAAAWLAGSAASAAVEVATFTGTVSNSQNFTGEFGTAGSLNGDSFVLTYTYDTSIGARTTTATKDELLSGASNVEPPSVRAELTINGTGQSFVGENYGLAMAQPGALQFEAQDCAPTPEPCADFNNYVTMLANPAGSPASLEALIPLAGATGTGEFSLVTYDPESQLYAHYAYGELDVASVALAPGVPEPATWAMMLVGAGLIGASLRMARRKDGMTVTAA